MVPRNRVGHLFSAPSVEGYSHFKTAAPFRGQTPQNWSSSCTEQNRSLQKQGVKDQYRCARQPSRLDPYEIQNTAYRDFRLLAVWAGSTSSSLLANLFFLASPHLRKGIHPSDAKGQKTGQKRRALVTWHITTGERGEATAVPSLVATISAFLRLDGRLVSTLLISRHWADLTPVSTVVDTWYAVTVARGWFFLSSFSRKGAKFGHFYFRKALNPIFPKTPCSDNILIFSFRKRHVQNKQSKQPWA